MHLNKVKKLNVLDILDSFIYYIYKFSFERVFYYAREKEKYD